MIIQENHAASKGLLILYHKVGLSFGKESPNERNQYKKRKQAHVLIFFFVYNLISNQPVEKIDDADHTINHEAGEKLAEDEDEGVDDDEAVFFNFSQDFAEGVG